MVLNGGDLDGARLISGDLLAEATRFQACNHPDVDDGYGLGFALAEWRGRTLANHDGGLPGVTTRIVVSQSDGVGVAVLSNGGDLLFTRRIAEGLLESELRLEPEAIPGSPRGVPPGQESEWADFTARVTGRYKMVDFAPPGVMKLIAGLMAKPRLTHFADNVLVLEGAGYQPAYLYPDGEVGRYRLALPLANGSRVVIEEEGGTHIWASILHMEKR
ncbi:MAG: hypothetical protein WEB00_09905 [Dehalococcoidia bacterium]